MSTNFTTRAYLSQYFKELCYKYKNKKTQNKKPEQFFKSFGFRYKFNIFYYPLLISEHKWHNGCTPYPLPFVSGLVLVNMLFIFFIVLISIRKFTKVYFNCKYFLFLISTRSKIRCINSTSFYFLLKSWVCFIIILSWLILAYP